MYRTLLAVAVALVALPSALAAQETLCAFDAPGRTTQAPVGADTIVTFHDRFTVTCDDGAELRANSGRLNRTLGELNLVGDVFFQDSIQSLTSDEATYNADASRLLALGNVVFTNRAEGSTLVGPELEYFRATDERPLAQVNAGQRPRLTLQPREETENAEPLDLVGDRVVIIGEDDLSAFGSVIITRSDFDASAGEARYNAATEDLELRQNAMIESEEYTLAGEVIQARLTDGSLEHVHSRTAAWLEGDDLRVEAPDLQLFFAADLLQRAVATTFGAAEGERAHAISRTFRLEADSLDATFIDQQLDVVHAVGTARGESIDTLAAEGAPTPVVADGMNPELADLLARDWIIGDTITGYFVSADAGADPEPDAIAALRPDTTAARPEDVEPSNVELRRLVARGSAQSVYRMTPEAERGNPDARQNLNFLVADEIELLLAGGELEAANAVGLKRGLYLEATDAPVPAGGTPPPTAQPALGGR